MKGKRGGGEGRGGEGKGGGESKCAFVPHNQFSKASHFHRQIRILSTRNNALCEIHVAHIELGYHTVSHQHTSNISHIV